METTGKSSDNLRLNTSVVKKLLVDFVRDEILNAGFKKGIVGLSGGVDSAVAMYIATEALGNKNVLAVMMPYKNSSSDSLADAKTVIGELKIPAEAVDITSMADGYIQKNG